jgi:hypothetical protein
MLTPTAQRRRERSKSDENDKEQSGAETVKIAAAVPDPGCISTLVTAR